jgi:hypothetical protein
MDGRDLNARRDTAGAIQLLGPDWIFRVGSTDLVALLVRAPFVGLVIRDDRVIHRT